MAGDKTLTFTDSTFDKDVLNSDVPVLVDFWAEWCGPCRAMTPTVDAVANDFEGRLKVGKLNVDDNNGTAGRYGVRSIPTILIFKDGKVVGSQIGAVGKPALLKLIEPHVAATAAVEAPAEPVKTTV